MKKNLNVPSKSNKQKNYENNLFFVGILKVTDEKSRIRKEPLVSVPDPDPYQNTTDPEHRLVGCRTVNIVDLWALVILF